MIGKSKFKIISYILSVCIIITLISFENISVRANNIASKPNFKIVDLTATPSEVKVGEDILVSGKIVPEDFETIIKPKEIVLVLDTSGSMSNSIKLKNNYKSTKIEELKKAAKSFVETMNGVPNLKIGIVAYSTEATINPYSYNKGKKEVKSIDSKNSYEVQNYKSYSSNILDNGNDMLNKIIDNIKPMGGTNIGEGIRKAIYMLDNGSENTDKTIVLMSDGKPTYYSVYNKDFYKEINNIYPSIAGTGSDTNDKTREYSNIIADMVKEKGYNAYSIGYGITDGKNDFMKIHASMRGLLNEKESTKENGFFETSDGSITEIFNQIAQNIKNSYELKDISLNLTFNKFFTLNIGGNKVNIGNINYNKISEDITNGKVVYHAEPVNFSFTVKGSEVGDAQLILNNIDINFLYNDENITINSKENVQVDIISNELPNIEAKLKGDKIININENKEITLSYEIDPQSFSFNDENNIRRSDVIFVIDVSKDMSSYMDPLVNDLWNDILNNDNLKAMKTKYSIVTFSNDFKNIINLDPSKYNSYSDYITDLNDNYIKKFLNSDNSNAKNISKTYKEIIDLLKDGRVGAKTNIVFISETSNISYGSESDYKFLRDNGYNIITVEIENKNNGNNKNDLYNFHNALNGTKNNYFYCTDKNDLQNNILSRVASSIIYNTSYNNYVFYPSLQIDLGENFELIDGGEVGVNNIVTIKIPELVYKYSKNSNIYIADKSFVNFKVQVKNGKVGNLNFGNENKLIYKKLIKNEDKYSLVETPTIIVKEKIKNLTHGLYNGIVNNNIEIKENTIVNGDGDSLILAEKSTLVMGSTFNTSSNSIEASLNIDDNFEVVKASDIIVYKVINNNGVETIEKVGEEKSSGSYTVDYINGQTNKIKISINDFNSKNEDTKILIVYKGTIKDNISNEMLTNKIEFGNGPYKDFSIKVNKEINTETEKSPKLPDLF